MGLLYLQDGQGDKGGRQQADQRGKYPPPNEKDQPHRQRVKERCQRPADKQHVAIFDPAGGV